MAKLSIYTGALILSALMLCSCVGPSIQFKSSRAQGYNKDPQRFFVVQDYLELSQYAYPAFQKAFSESLKNCGADAQIYDTPKRTTTSKLSFDNSEQNNFKAKLNEAAQSYRPDVTLLILETSSATGPGVLKNTYTIEMRDFFQKGELIWKGQMHTNTGNGKTLANALLTGLRSNGFLKNCPASEPLLKLES